MKLFGGLRFFSVLRGPETNKFENLCFRHIKRDTVTPLVLVLFIQQVFIEHLLCARHCARLNSSSFLVNILFQ